jgi:hypothetical protein
LEKRRWKLFAEMECKRDEVHAGINATRYGRLRCEASRIAHLVIPPECRKELEFKPCSAEPNNPDWCSGKYRMRFVCTKVVK